MADTAAFNFVCEQIESLSGLDRLEARGTVRLALKDARLDASIVTPNEMRDVLETVLPEQLISRGIANGGAICQAILNESVGIQPKSSSADTAKGDSASPSARTTSDLPDSD